MQLRIARAAGVAVSAPEELAASNVLNHWAVKHGRPLLVGKSHHPQADALLQAVGAGSALAVPLFVNSRVMGSLQFFSPAAANFSKEDAQLLWIMSLVAENLLTREYANQGLMRVSFTDFLPRLQT